MASEFPSQEFPSQRRLLECLDEVWSEQTGANILLFQDDLFRRIRQLEALLEGDCEVTHGFLEDCRGLVWAAPAAYAALWAQIEAEAKELTLESLDILEDCICNWAEEAIPDELAFFDAALETGHLDAVWTDRANVLLFSGLRPKRPEANAAAMADTEPAVIKDPEPQSQPLTVQEVAVPMATPNEIVIPEPRAETRFTRRRVTNLLTPSQARRRVRRTRKSHKH